MSTKLTNDGSTASSSPSLNLVRQVSCLYDLIMRRVCRQLADTGHAQVTPANLLFLSKLDHQAAVASDIARELRVSRQRIAKTVKDMKEAGYIEQAERAGTRKTLQLTPAGCELTRAAKKGFANLDGLLAESAPGLELVPLVTDLGRLLRELEDLDAAETANTGP